MDSLTISIENIQKLKQSFDELDIKPEFTISEEIRANLLLFKRKDSFFCVRAGL